jgi:ankyrin repeat protein
MTEEQQILEEANRELLECARYGEDEDLLTLMNQYRANVNHTDDNGNTALHRAAANGHIKCLQALKEHGALHVKNKEGNYPIHWAAQNGQAEALKFLFDCYEVDVLEKNDQGRSTLTEAFQSGNANAIECCLSHPTASEDKLIPGKAPTSEEEPVEAASPEKNEVTHVMKFSPLGDVVKIRELPITRADHPFGSEERPEDDTTGIALTVPLFLE